MNSVLSPDDLGGAPDAARLTALQDGLATLASRGEILRTEIRDPAGRLVVADTDTRASDTAAISRSFRGALTGKVQAEIVTGEAAETIGAVLTQRYLIRAYLPIISGGEVKRSRSRSSTSTTSGCSTIRTATRPAIGR